MHSRAMLTALAATMVVAGCADSTGPAGTDGPDDGAVAEVRLAQLSGARVGDTIRLRGRALDRRGRVLPDSMIEWRTTDPSVAIVEDGLLIPVRAGRAQVVAAAGAARSQATVVADWGGTTLQSLSITPDSASVEEGQGEQLTAMLRFSNGLEVQLRSSVQWRSLDGTIATVRNGRLTGARAGKTSVVANVAGLQDTVVVTVGPRSQARVVTIPATIDPTGAADVTGALNAFFASVPDTTTIRFPAGARYRVEGTLLFKSRRALTLDGNGATVFATTDGSGVTPQPEIAHKWPRKRTHLMFLGGEQIVVRNLVVDGANANAGLGDAAFVVELEAQHGFEFAGVRGGELDRVTVTDVYGDFVYMGKSNGQLSSNIWVHDSRFERNGRQGMAFTGAEDVVIERNYMSDVRRAHFDLEPNIATDVIRRLTIRKNRFGPGRLLFLASGGASGTIEDVTVEQNVLTGKPLNILVKPPTSSRRARFRIVNNVSDFVFGSPAPLMQFERIDGVVVRGNRNPLQANRAMIGIRTRESCSVDIQGNDFPNGATEFVVESPDCGA